GVVEAYEDGTCGHVLTPGDGDLRDATVDTCRDVEPCRIHFALDEQRLGPDEIPDRQRSDAENDEGENDRGSLGRLGARPLCLRLRRARWPRNGYDFRRWLDRLVGDRCVLRRLRRLDWLDVLVEHRFRGELLLWRRSVARVDNCPCGSVVVARHLS